MTITLDPALLTICVILFGAGWLLVGYILGWNDGVEAGFDAGWKSMHEKVLTLMREIKESR